MRGKIIFFFVIFCSSNLFAQFDTERFTPVNAVKKQRDISQQDLISIPASGQSKILSGRLMMNVSRKTAAFKERSASPDGTGILQVPEETVTIYMNEYPTDAQIAQMEAEGIKCFMESWIPSLPNHPLGFFLAKMPVDKIQQTLSFAFVKKMDTAEYESFPENNFATAAINANGVWSGTPGYTGSGVKVAILDSGIDIGYAGTELPASFERKDYSNYPTSTDDIVANTVTGHGTHVAGSVLGKGYYSNGRADDGNGSAAFKGSAPNAGLVFLKIGDDASASAYDAGMIEAMHAAVSTYNANILTMSYGGWYAHHDGSSSVEQAVDWVYSQGKPFFVSAGNNGSAAMHYSGIVNANSSTDFIAVTVPVNGKLSYNLVWYDGPGVTNDLTLEYYNASQTKFNNVVTNPTTESPRGTESQYSSCPTTITAGGTCYLKVVNNSSNSQFYHIYFDNIGYGTVTFNSPDPYYTIGQPASADHAFAVGAYSSRYSWTNSSGASGYHYTNANPLNDIAVFSSRGPRVNGGVTKPDICAPGTAIISLRDQDVYTSLNNFWIDDNGATGDGNAHYYVMQGTSMACPIAAGSAALLLEKQPTATAQNVYDAMTATAASSAETGALPNATWGNGKLNVLAALSSPVLPVELESFTVVTEGTSVLLSWRTATEISNYGFEVLRASKSGSWEKIGFVPGAGNSNSQKSYSFADQSVLSGKYSYRLKQIDNDGKFTLSEEIDVNITQLPKDFYLSQNHPNPFNPSTTISYELPEASQVTLKVYDITGREVASLVNGRQEAGKYKSSFDASNLATGIYFARLNTEKYIKTIKMSLIK